MMLLHDERYGWTWVCSQCHANNEDFTPLWKALVRFVKHHIACEARRRLGMDMEHARALQDQCIAAQAAALKSETSNQLCN